LTVEGLKAAQPQSFDAIRQAMDNKDLTDAQRDQIRDNMRKVWEERMNSNINEYYAASGDEKKKVLDKHIDEMQKFMEERRKRDEKMTEEERQKERDRWRNGGPGGPGGQGPSREQRMARSQSRNPDRMAKFMGYTAAMQERMKERGIQPPPWGGSG